MVVSWHLLGGAEEKHDVKLFTSHPISGTVKLVNVADLLFNT
jgi:hypothetical protein